tara:strand:- start:95 stop:316 length:222 start_codon:yes stop_codon:yes gene_type:complete
MHKNDFKVDPAHTKAMGGRSAGIVGDSAIWDGPLSQQGRLHGEGASNGIYGMKLKTAPVPLGGRGPITQIAKG